MIKLEVHRLGAEVLLPTYGTSLSTCFDVRYCPMGTTISGYNNCNDSIIREVLSDGSFKIEWGDRLLVPTGLVFKIKKETSVENFSEIISRETPLKTFSIRLHARSGMALKRGLILANSEGIVDVDYQQQVYVLLTNISCIPQIVVKQERLAQAEIVVNEPFLLVESPVQPQQYSERDGGFGSTGAI